MATWTPNVGRLYLPPSQPVARVLSTDEYVIPTNIYFYANTDRLLTVGHPYFDVVDSNNQNKILVPKVSGNQYRVLRLKLPDPNKFALIDKDIHNPETERLVWRLSGIEIDRGGPLGIGTTGHPLFDKQNDTENPNSYLNLNNSTENRLNLSFDPKQNQLFIVGCAPAVGQHWDVAEPCDPESQKGLCPPIKLVHTKIQDGDMSDIGLGHVNFSTFSESRADAPLEVINSICKWPDFINMTKDIYGDSMFFFGKREQLYTRHMLCKDGVVGDSIPDDPDAVHKRFFIDPKADTAPYSNLGNSTYFPTPSGSLVSSETQLFNRPYWVHKAQGHNNGVCWGNNLFVTILDNTHNTNFILSVYKEDTPMTAQYQYKSTDFRHYMRHCEEVEVELVLQLCKVPLQANILAHINAMNPSILDEWQLAFVPSPPQNIEDTYRFIQSLATMCPKDAQQQKTPEDPYKDLVFWNINLEDKFSSDLDQTPLGKKFLYQMGMISTKRVRDLYSTTTPSTSRRRTTKRKRTATARG
ncbi:L1 [Human papillomavirus 181]|nr:L1 [Human papillomavirus 181]